MKAINKLLIPFLVTPFFIGCAGTAVKDEAAPEAKPASQPAKIKQTQAKAPSLNEVQLKALLVGNTKVGMHKGKKWTDTFNPDGTLIGTYGSDGDTGTFTIKGDLVCRQWSKWRKGVESCWSIQKRENDYYATLKSGNSGSHKFTMSKKQPESSSLNEAQLKALFVGHTHSGVHLGKSFVNKYQPGGILTGTFGSDVDTGTYMIKGNLYCREWKKWGKTSCFTIQKRDDGYSATVKSGKSKSYEFKMQ